MSDANAPVTSDDQDADHDSGHGHEAAGEPLGAPDMRAWGAAILGGGIGLIVALALYIAIRA
jgi:hypothetical protein